MTWTFPRPAEAEAQRWRRGTTACSYVLTWAAKPLQGCGLALALQAPTAKSASSARLGTCSATSKAEHPLLDQVLQEVEHGIGLIQRQGFERAGNRINSFRPDPA